jgi:hypothetical protein
MGRSVSRVGWCGSRWPIEVFGPPPLSTEMVRLANDGVAGLVQKHTDRFLPFICGPQ